jgi:hypothetical protein
VTVEYVRDFFKVDQVVGEELSQVIVEGDIIISESKPEIAKVLNVSGMVVVNSREVIQDRVMVEGGVRYNVLYIAEENEQLIESTEAEIGFTQYLEIPGAKPNMTSVLKCQVEHIEYDIVNNRKLNIKTVLNLEGQVNQVLQLEVIRDFKERPDIQVLKDRVRAVSTEGHGSSQAIIREDLELTDDLPSIEKILKKDASIRINEKKVVDNKVIVHGEIKLQLLYTCGEESEPIQYIDYDMPFSHSIDIHGAYQGMGCAADVWAQELFIEPREDINRELRIVSIEVVVAATAQVFETDELELLVDAYCPGVVLELKKRKIKLTQMQGENQGQTVVKESVAFPENIPHVDKMLHVEVKPIVTDHRISEGKVIIEGVLITNIIYQSNDTQQTISSHKEDIPFRQSVEIEGIREDMYCDSELMVEHTDFTLVAPDEVELRIVVTAKVGVFSSIDKEVLLGVDITEVKDSKDSGIFIYFTQAGDSLWSVAKRYNTTMSNLLKYNAVDDPEHLKPGDKLLIYKKLESFII